MKRRLISILFALASAAGLISRDEAVLRRELAILQPLVGGMWVAESKDPSGRMTLHHELKYELMYGGKVLHSSKVVRELNYQGDGYFYYDADKKEIAFLFLSSNGNVTRGSVRLEEGKILLVGHAIFPDRKLEFRNTLEITAEGKLVDLYHRLEGGAWQAGHSFVYERK